MESEPGPRRVCVVIRGGLLVLLLVAEIATLSTRFTIHWSAHRQWVTWLLLAVNTGSRVLLAVAAGVVLVRGAELWAWIGPGLGRPYPFRRWWPFLLGHAAALAGLTLATAGLFEGKLAAGDWAFVWLAAWVGLGLATLLFWTLLVAPPEVCAGVLHRLKPVLLLCGAIGGSAWLVSRETALLWDSRLNRSTLWLVRRLLGLLSRDVVYEPSTASIGTSRFTAEIGTGCGGYEGIGLVLILSITYLWLFRARLRFPRVLVLVPLGVVVIWLSNSVRIVGLVAIGTWVSPAVAEEGFHSVAGWLAFLAISLGLIALTQLRAFARDAEDVSADPAHPGGVTADPTAAYLAPWLAIMATAIVIQSVTASGRGDVAYPLMVIAAAAALAVFRKQYETLRWTVSGFAVLMGVVVYGLWLALEPLAPAKAHVSGAPPGVAALTGTAWAVWLAFRVVGSAVTVPLAEELAFRGYLARRLMATDFRSVPIGHFNTFSLVVSSLLFGLMHGRWLAGVVAGLLYALCLARRRELTDAVVAHGVTNALIAAHVLAFHQWGLWS